MKIPTEGPFRCAETHMEKIDLAIIDVIFHGQYSIAIHYIHGRPQEFFQGGGKPLGGPQKICEGGPPYFFRQALKYAYRGRGGVVLMPA